MLKYPHATLDKEKIYKALINYTLKSSDVSVGKIAFMVIKGYG